MSRNANDLYPTPPDAVFALRDWLDAHYPRQLRTGIWMDRCAGFGTLPEWLGVGRPRRRALELSTHPEIVTELERRYDEDNYEVGVDSLERPGVQADAGAHTVENPPFSAVQAFVASAASDFVAARRTTIACLLVPVGFWHGKRRLHIPDPTYQLALTWRPNFAAGYGAEDAEYSGTFQDFVWSVYAPRRPEFADTIWKRLVRPVVPDELVREHARLAHIAARLA